jgi:hypothetical protein
MWLLDNNLVEQEIIISFLPKGHTHEDVDQLFSRLSVYLRRHDAHCRDALCRAFEQAYTTKDAVPLRALYVDRLSNFSGWIHPYLNHKFFEGISTYHQFRFEFNHYFLGFTRHQATKSKLCAESFVQNLRICPAPGIRLQAWLPHCLLPLALQLGTWRFGDLCYQND